MQQQRGEPSCTFCTCNRPCCASLCCCMHSCHADDRPQPLHVAAQHMPTLLMCGDWVVGAGVCLHVLLRHSSTTADTCNAWRVVSCCGPPPSSPVGDDRREA